MDKTKDSRTNHANNVRFFKSVEVFAKEQLEKFNNFDEAQNHINSIIKIVDPESKTGLKWIDYYLDAKNVLTRLEIEHKRKLRKINWKD